MSEQEDPPRKAGEAQSDDGPVEGGDEARASEAEEGGKSRALVPRSRKGDDEDEGDVDEAAERVADALGVGDGSEEGAQVAETAEPSAPANRSARRREEALERRRKKRGAEKPVVAAAEGDAEIVADGPLPRDKNARAKELLRRRKEEAAGRRDVALAPSEMVDDAVARMSSSAGKWFRDNFPILQWVILAGIVGTAGYVFYTSHTEQTAAEASDALAEAVTAERGRVMAEDKRTDEEKEADFGRVFPTAEDRADVALAAYNKVIDEHPKTGAAILAKLGQGGVYIDKKQYKEALAAYAEVIASTLASADPDVKGRAIEGQGFAKEGMGDADGALASFKELEGIDAKGYKELSMYHQARLLLAKGDKEKAKELLKAARDKLQEPSVEGKSTQFLEAVVDEELRALDPTAVPARASSLGGPKGNTLSQEDIERLLKKAKEAGEKKGMDPHEGE